MRTYVASTSGDLTAHRAAAAEVMAEMGLEAVTAEPPGDHAGRGAVAACARLVAHADLVLAIVGWQQGEVPGPELGGDGRRSWTEWEVRSALRQAKPVVVLRADDGWPPELRESDSAASARVADFRGELERLAVPFAAEPEPLPEFRLRVRRELDPFRRGGWLGDRTPEIDDAVRPRQWPAPALPERPYPLLLPYAHPDLLGGRQRELEELLRRLDEPVPILGLYAPSGAGKSSLLGGGLIPWLRAAGRPAAFERHPDEPGLADRLLGDLLTPVIRAEDDFRAFVDRLLAAARLGGRPPVLVLDQFEDLLRAGKAPRRAVVGRLLAASTQRLPGYAGPVCRWLLAYRQELHGEVCGWLANVLGDSSGSGGWVRLRRNEEAPELPHDLSGPERFHAWALPPLGTPAPGSKDRAGEAARAFREAIETPLALRDESHRPRYPWRFADGAAARLARAFGEARLARPGAPLAPELQVVLAYLLERSGEPPVVEVPEDPAELIDQALEEHLRRALGLAFPSGRAAAGRASLGRTRALLALRELTDAHGRRRKGLSVDVLAPAIGEEGREVLEKLATPQTRLVVLEEQPEGWCYVLSHDRMAEVLVRLVDGEEYAGLGVDAELLGLRRFVALRTELFKAGEVEQATEAGRHGRRIEAHADALLWGDEHRRWWAAYQERRRTDRQRNVTRWGIAAAVVTLVILGAWSWADRLTSRRALLAQISSGEPEAAFATLAQLTAEGAGSEELLAQLRQREKPFEVLGRGLGGVDEEQRGAAVLRVAELVLPLFEEAPRDPVRIASTVWALDRFAAPNRTLWEQALALRDTVLEPLRRSRPPPPAPRSAEDPDWVDVPAGTFRMGPWPTDGPAHQVTLSAFRILTHEVTRGELRRLMPDHPGEADLPVESVTWYEAYTYAAWLGGRLPSEAEWEYAARAGCAFLYCKRDGSEATIDEVAWWSGNSTDLETGEVSVRPVMRLEPNPWGLFDVYGNVWEMTADWRGVYPEEAVVDPPGRTDNAINLRVGRGGGASDPAEWIVPQARGAGPGEVRIPYDGFRVVLAARKE